MEKRFKETYPDGTDMWELTTDADHILHFKDSDNYSPIKRFTTANPEDWEEIAIEDIPPYTNAEYAAKVSELIHQKYSLDDEIALHANLEDGPTEKRTNEFAEYLAFRKQCKEDAKKLLTEEANKKKNSENNEEDMNK